MRRLTIQQMQEIAKTRGGRCLSEKYTNIDTKIRWQCKEGHIWESTGYRIKTGAWCPKCGNISGWQKRRPREIEILKMKTLAESIGGLCISDSYVNQTTKLKWKCNKGHEWNAAPAGIKNGTWCPHCSHRVKITLPEMKGLAISRGGKCLSENYIDSHSKLDWQCKEGHRWKASAQGVKSGHWCPKCAHSEKLTLDEMQKIAESKGGKCLSNQYVNARTKLEWECKDGHRWYAIPDAVKRLSWCPVCGNKSRSDSQRGNIQELLDLAAARDGRLLSETYVNSQTKLEWQCKYGHMWKAVPASIKIGRWCPKCGFVKRADKLRLNIEEMKEIARLRGGECLSDGYVNAYKRLEWKCKAGHVWRATPSIVKFGKSWCPICSQRLNERICRHYFEAMFGREFPSLRPKWLVTSRGTRLELDGYCEELNLAFEYNGIQHYASIKFFNSTTSFEKRKKYDDIKKRVCKLHGVRLIVIPFKIKPKDIGKYIYKQCERLKIEVPNRNIELNDLQFYYPEIIEELNEIAKSRGGELLSNSYINSQSKLEWKCKIGHVWYASSNDIKNRRWCPNCSQRKRITIERMQELAKLKGGECLSLKCSGAKIKLKWRCHAGHIWRTTPDSISQGSWCQECYKNRKIHRLLINHPKPTTSLQRAKQAT